MGGLKTIYIIVVFIANLAVLLGIFIALKGYRSSVKNNALSNAISLVDNFHRSLSRGELKDFRNIIVMNGESSGGDNVGHYMDSDGNMQNFGLYFTEGMPDDGALDRVCNNLERVCFFAFEGDVNKDFIFSELGQIMRVCYHVLNAITTGERGLLSEFKSIEKFYEKYEDRTDIPVRVIGHIE